MCKNYIARPLYLDKIQPFIDKNLIKILTGQRRSGKSYMLYQLMDLVRLKNPKSSVIYINKEQHEFSQIKNSEDLINYVAGKCSSNAKTYIFIDEIQEIKNFETALINFHSGGEVDIYCTGSNAKMFSGEIATRLRGRYIEIKIHTLSYTEFLTFHALENTDESLNKYLQFGGLPFLIHLELDENVAFEYIKSVYSTVILKDVIERNSIRNIDFLENLIRYLADNVGNILSAKKISDYLKSQHIQISPSIILNYLNHLSSAFVINKVRRSDIHGKKIFEINDKYYFEDLGIRNSLSGFKITDINKILENAVFHHLKLSGYKVLVGKLRDLEIDFVAEKGDEKLYIQVAYLLLNDETRKREFGNLMEIKDNYKKLVVSMDKVTGGNVKGIYHQHIKDFLSHYV